VLLSDIIGKAVTTLVNEEPNSRSYEKEWNPANIAIGIPTIRMPSQNGGEVNCAFRQRVWQGSIQRQPGGGQFSPYPSKGSGESEGVRGRDSPYLPEIEETQLRDWRKARFFLLLFLVKKK